MKFIDLDIIGFGKFHDVHIEFQDGLNLLYGRNEAGKSTLHSFIRGMLFGIEKKPGRASRTDLYSRYEPWEKSTVYEGRMRISYQGNVYRIERIFQKSAKSLKIINETDGTQLKDPKAFLNEALAGLSETAFANTVSIGQLKSATDAGMVSELKNYIANLNTSGDMSLNISDASEYLKRQRRELDAKRVPETAKTYSALIGEIRNIEREISQPEYENQLTHFTELKTQLGTRVLNMQAEREQLLQKIAGNEQVLRLSGFHTKEDIYSCRDAAEEQYRHHNALQALCRRRSRIILPFCMLLLSFLALAGSAVVALLTYPQISAAPGLAAVLQSEQALALSAAINDFFMPPAVMTGMFGILAMILLLCSIIAFSGNAKNKKMLQETQTVLSDILRRHTGNPEISEQAMQGFGTRMEEMLRMEQEILDNRTQVAELGTALSRLSAEEHAYAEQVQLQQRKQWELERKLEHLTNLKNRAEQLNCILAENDAITQEIDAINLALETLTELSRSIRSSFGHYLNKEASELITGITGGIYNSMSIDENLNVFMNTPTKLVPVEQVSSGTMDQIYLALRLAAAKLIQGDAEALPLIFDDSFALYDDERLRAALSWISKAYPEQILLFTCHQREYRLLREKQIPFHLIRM